MECWSEHVGRRIQQKPTPFARVHQTTHSNKLQQSAKAITVLSMNARSVANRLSVLECAVAAHQPHVITET